jgi:hypothetical protein
MKYASGGPAFHFVANICHLATTYKGAQTHTKHVWGGSGKKLQYLKDLFCEMGRFR